MVKTITKSTKIISVTLLILLSSNTYATGHSRNSKSSLSKYFSYKTYAIKKHYAKKKYFAKKKHFANKNLSGNQGTPSVPLDGELGLLLLGGAAFGIKKLRDNKSKA